MAVSGPWNCEWKVLTAVSFISIAAAMHLCSRLIRITPCVPMFDRHRPQDSSSLLYYCRLIGLLVGCSCHETHFQFQLQFQSFSNSYVVNIFNDLGCVHPAGKSVPNPISVVFFLCQSERHKSDFFPSGHFHMCS